MRAVVRAAASVAVVSLAAGCSTGPEYRPDMPGIPQARAVATRVIDDAVARLTFSDRVTVLASGRSDACGADGDGTLFDRSVQYRCSMGAMVVLAVPGARSREDVIGAVDAELARMAPFPRLTFRLTAAATSQDMQRVRDCLTAGLHSGAIAVVTPGS